MSSEQVDSSLKRAFTAELRDRVRFEMLPRLAGDFFIFGHVSYRLISELVITGPGFELPITEIEDGLAAMQEACEKTSVIETAGRYYRPPGMSMIYRHHWLCLKVEFNTFRAIRVISVVRGSVL